MQFGSGKGVRVDFITCVANLQVIIFVIKQSQQNIRNFIACNVTLEKLLGVSFILFILHLFINY